MTNAPHRPFFGGTGFGIPKKFPAVRMRKCRAGFFPLYTPFSRHLKPLESLYRVLPMYISMEANQAKPDFYIYALVSTNENVKGENSLRVDVGTFDGLGESIEYIGISRNMPQKRLSQHHASKNKNLGMFVLDSEIKSEWHALRDEAKYVSDYFDQYGEAPKLQGAANSGKY